MKSYLKKRSTQDRASGVAQVVQHLLSKHETLSSKSHVLEKEKKGIKQFYHSKEFSCATPLIILWLKVILFFKNVHVPCTFFPYSKSIATGIKHL
jgi:hypothetical protein